MTLPNQLTVLRMALAPLVLVLFLWAPGNIWFLAAGWFIFLLAELTDVLDGFLARKLGLVSELGKILDPFADVVSRLTYFTLFLLQDLFPLWAFLPILYRELGLTFLRMILLKKGTALAANWAGKTKAWFYFSLSVLLLGEMTMRNLNLPLPPFVRPTFEALCGLTAFLSVLSAVPYLRAAKKLGLWTD